MDCIKIRNLYFLKDIVKRQKKKKKSQDKDREKYQNITYVIKESRISKEASKLKLGIQHPI